MRWMILSLVSVAVFVSLLVISPSFADPVYYPIETSQKAPVYNKAIGLYGSIQEPIKESDKSTSSGNTITVSAVVLPVRIITVYDDRLAVSSNTQDDQSYWIAQDVDNKRLVLTQEIWNIVRECTAQSVRQIGPEICSIKLRN